MQWAYIVSKATGLGFHTFWFMKFILKAMLEFNSVWRHHTEKSGYKAATFENNFAQSSQLAEKNAFSFSSFAEN